VVPAKSAWSIDVAGDVDVARSAVVDLLGSLEERRRHSMHGEPFVDGELHGYEFRFSLKNFFLKGTTGECRGRIVATESGSRITASSEGQVSPFAVWIIWVLIVSVLAAMEWSRHQEGLQVRWMLAGFFLAWSVVVVISTIWIRRRADRSASNELRRRLESIVAGMEQRGH
jgi:hypothetical protein